MDNLKEIRLGRNFTLDEFVKTATGLDNIPGEREIENLRALVENILQPLRNHIGRSVIITSGYRSPLVNATIGGADTSQHLTGHAADFYIPGMTNAEIVQTIRSIQLPYDQLIDEFLSGRYWIHVSYDMGRMRGEWLTARDVGTGRPSKYVLESSGYA